ncbi:unnamed protein product [Ilex paraguariensis]|uniref:PGG domain-containing protein n=1 Tax=Ilex paraguariensis TaxID=185542 RepID=A0ABC8RPN3_9AQUA
MVKDNIIHIALEHEDENMVQCFLDTFRGTCNDLVTQKDVDGNTTLHLMAASNLKMPQLINHFMADKAALNKQNCTPLDMAPRKHGDLWMALSRAGSTSSFQKVMSCRQSEIKKVTVEKDLLAQEKEKLAEMRKTFDTNMIVAAVIATVPFTAGFTMPGGYNESGTQNPVPGMALLSQKICFSSIYAILAMMVAFSTTTYVVLEQSLTLAITTCVVGVISILISFLLRCKFMW